MSNSGLKKSNDTLRLISGDSNHTFKLGEAFGQGAFSGGVIALIGPLGAGKTRFVQGLASGLGIPPSTVNSPTYGLVHLHTEGRLPLCHVDLYRLSNPDEIESLGLEEDLEGEGVSAIEWADKALAILPSGRVVLEINDRDDHEDQREIVLRGSDTQHRDWIERALTTSTMIPKEIDKVAQ